MIDALIWLNYSSFLFAANSLLSRLAYREWQKKNDLSSEAKASILAKLSGYAYSHLVLMILGLLLFEDGTGFLAPIGIAFALVHVSLVLGKWTAEVRQTPWDVDLKFNKLRKYKEWKPLLAFLAYLAFGGFYVVGMVSLITIYPSWILFLLLLGLEIVFLLSILPLVIKILVNAKNIPKSLDLKFQEKLQLSGLKKLEIKVLGDKRFKNANAFITGFNFVPQFMRGQVYLTESLFEEFNEDEIIAIVCHELAHYSRNHLIVRGMVNLIATVCQFIGMMLITGAATIGWEKHIPKSELFYNFPVLTTVACGALFIGLLALMLLLTIAAVKPVGREQELEADWTAIKVFGINPSGYFEVLKKITLFNDGSLSKTHWLDKFSSARFTRLFNNAKSLF